MPIFSSSPKSLCNREEGQKGNEVEAQKRKKDGRE
jgi:hypothetical protein